MPGVQWWLQPKGPETVHLLDEDGPELSYSLPEFGITMPFKPTDFTQVNPHINRVLVPARVAPARSRSRDERVIDWFCGLGNFTLPIATRAALGAGHRRQRGAGGALARELRAQQGLAGAAGGRWRRPRLRRATCS